VSGRCVPAGPAQQCECGFSFFPPSCASQERNGAFPFFPLLMLEGEARAFLCLRREGSSRRPHSPPHVLFFFSPRKWESLPLSSPVRKFLGVGPFSPLPFPPSCKLKALRDSEAPPCSLRSRPRSSSPSCVAFLFSCFRERTHSRASSNRDLEAFS